jgi:hypothetical protein
MGCSGAHLPPNSIVILAVFSHLCEMFIGVEPCLLFFRQFFLLRFSNYDDSVGCYSFLLHPQVRYIAKNQWKKWDDWKWD